VGIENSDEREGLLLGQQEEIDPLDDESLLLRRLESKNEEE